MAFVQFGFTTHVKTIQAKRFYKKKKKLCRKKLQNIKQSFLGLIEHFQSWNRKPVNRHRYVSTFWVSEITLGTMNPLTCFISFIPFFNLFFFCIFLKKKRKRGKKLKAGVTNLSFHLLSCSGGDWPSPTGLRFYYRNMNLNIWTSSEMYLTTTLFPLISWPKSSKLTRGE